MLFAGCSNDEPPNLVPMHCLGGEELPKIFSKCVRRTQPELYTFLLLQYTNATAVIVNLLNIKEDTAGQMFEQ